MAIASDIVAGALQGLLEWIPVSSQGSVMIFLSLFGKIDLSSAFSQSIALHLGTAIAAIIYFRKNVFKLIKNLPRYFFDIHIERKLLFSSEEHRYTSFLIVSSFVTALVAIPLYGLIDSFLKTPSIGESFLGVIGFMLVLTGIIQQRKSGKKTKKDLHMSDSVIFGFAQGFALLPGISRSGITVFALLLRSYRTEDALFLSFLASIPATLGAQFLVLHSFDSFSPIALVVAALVGLASIELMLRIARKINFSSFCIVYGTIAILIAIYSNLCLMNLVPGIC